MQHVFTGNAAGCVIADTMQFVTVGNLQILLSDGGDGIPTGAGLGVTSSGANSQSFTNRQSANEAGFYAQILDSANVNAGNNTLIVNWSATTVGFHGYLLLDVVGADTSPYDTSTDLANQLQNTGNKTPLATCTLAPNTSNGLVVSVTQISDNTLTDPTSPSGAYSINATEQHTANINTGDVIGTLSDENNGFGIFYNPDKSSITYTWTQHGNYNYVSGWSSSIAAYKAVNAAISVLSTFSFSTSGQGVKSTVHGMNLE